MAYYVGKLCFGNFSRLGCSILIWMLSLFTDMPLVGEYARNIEKTVSEYANDINYEDELERVGETLERIEKALNKEAR